jgi:hypothetical protein
MPYWILPFTFLLGGLAGGLLAWTWRGRSDAVTRRQKIKLVAATAFVTVALLSITGCAVLRARFGQTQVDRASTGQAVADLRRAGGAAHQAGTPPGGVYTFRARGGMKVRSALLGNTTRTLPPTVPAVLVPQPHKPGCWELTLRLFKKNHRAYAAGRRLGAEAPPEERGGSRPPGGGACPGDWIERPSFATDARWCCPR